MFYLTRKALVCALMVASPVPTWTASPTVSSAPVALRVGEIDFPTSGRAEAQPHFRRGVAALHSFWYEVALDEFNAALGLDPEFAMAWWGVAMCYHRPFIPGSDDEAGRQALSRIRNALSLSAREHNYIDALRAWYGDGAPLVRAQAYATAMQKIHLAWPDDLEAAAFYALSLLGPAWGESDFASRHATAGALAQEVYRRNPNHPGAAHYIIHSFDEPELASRALAAAEHYAAIAPDAPHAQHMPSHIFLQLGMWKETSTANDAAWSASEAWVRRRALNPALLDYHNLHWLIYSCLQQGRYARAAELLEEFRRVRNMLPAEARQSFNQAVAAYIVDTRRWDRAEALFDPGDGSGLAGSRLPAGRAVDVCGAPVEPRPAAMADIQPSDIPAFIRTLAAANRGATNTQQRLDDLYAGAGGDLAMPDYWRVRVLEVAAVLRARANRFEEAIQALRQATAIEEELGKPPGPPMALKPPHELLGEILLQAGRAAEAATQFRRNLARHPNRALSLLGCARAEAAADNPRAAVASYRQLLEIWAHADADLPELREAREYAGSAKEQ